MRCILLLSVYILLSLDAMAQTRLGIRGGTLLHSLEGSRIYYEKVRGSGATSRIQENHKRSIHAGIVIDHRVNNYIFVQTGLDYTEREHQRWDTLYFNNTSNWSSYRTKIQYIEIPNFVKVGVPAGAFRFDLITGLSVGYGFDGFVFSSTPNSYANGNREATESIFEDKIPQERLNVMWVTGAMVTYSYKNTSLFIDGRYQNAINNLEVLSTADEATVKNRGIGLSAGIMFKLRKPDEDFLLID
jgi:hypothetical protein